MNKNTIIADEYDVQSMSDAELLLWRSQHHQNFENLKIWSTIKKYNKQIQNNPPIHENIGFPVVS